MDYCNAVSLNSLNARAKRPYNQIGISLDALPHISEIYHIDNCAK